MSIWATGIDVTSLLKDFGLPIALCLFFIWQNKISQESYRKESREREAELGNRLTAVETFVQDELMTVVKDNTAVLSRMERWLEKQERET